MPIIFSKFVFFYPEQITKLNSSELFLKAMIHQIFQTLNNTFEIQLPNHLPNQRNNPLSKA